MASVKTQLINALLQRFPDNQFRFTDITRALMEDVRGIPYKYEHRGMGGTNLVPQYRGSDGKMYGGGYLRKPSKREPRFLDKVNGVWTVRL